MTRTKELSELSDAELLTKLESSVCSAVRYTYTAVRLSEEYQRRMKPDENLPTKLGAILTISTGLQNTVSGCGDMFDNFMSSGDVNKYTGVSGKPTKYYENGWQDALLRLMKYDQSFYKMPYDCRKSLVFDDEKDVVLKKPRKKRVSKSKSHGSRKVQSQQPITDLVEGQEAEDCDDIDPSEVQVQVGPKKRSTKTKRKDKRKLDLLASDDKEVSPSDNIVQSPLKKKMRIALRGKDLLPKEKKGHGKIIKTAAVVRNKSQKNKGVIFEQSQKPKKRLPAAEVRHKSENKIESLAEIRREQIRLRQVQREALLQESSDTELSTHISQEESISDS